MTDESLNIQICLIKVELSTLTCRHAVPHWKALRYGKYGLRNLGCGSTFSICQDVLKSDNLLHKRGLVDYQMVATVPS